MSPTKQKQGSLEEQDNPFETAEPFEASLGRMLEDGDFLVAIVDIDASETASTGMPAAKVRFENDEGYFERKIYYDRDVLGRITQLIVSAGVETPKSGEFDPSDRYRLSQSYLDTLVGKEVGIVIRPEYNEQKGKTYQELKGITTAEKMREHLGDRASSPSGARQAGPPPQTDEDIPF